eukprot:6770293-Prymnesium_polylepis.1
MLDGKLVPFLECDEAYEYLGRMTRLDGNNADGKGKINSKLEVAFRRLRRMHRPSRNAFMIWSEGLVNSLVAYCGHHLHIVGRSVEVGGEVAPHLQQQIRKGEQRAAGRAVRP